MQSIFHSFLRRGLHAVGPAGPEHARKVPCRAFLRVVKPGGKPQKFLLPAGIWSLSAFLLDVLLLGYYMENYVGVEARTTARCQVPGVGCQELEVRSQESGARSQESGFGARDWGLGLGA